MKLDSDIFALLTRAIRVGKVMGIEEIAMEENEKGTMFRGMADVGGTPVVMLQEIDEDLPFTGIGIPSAASFLNKEKLAFDNDDGYTVYAQIDTMSNSVKSLDYKGGRFKMNINAAKTNVIRAPKAIRDVDVLAIEITDAEAKTIKQAVSAFRKAELVDVVSDGDSVTLEIRSAEDGGTFTFDLENEPLDLSGDEEAFVHSYPVKTFLNLIDNMESRVIKIGKQGVLNGSIDNIRLFIFPRRK